MVVADCIYFYKICTFQNHTETRDEPHFLVHWQSQVYRIYKHWWGYHNYETFGLGAEKELSMSRTHQKTEVRARETHAWTWETILRRSRILHRKQHCIICLANSRHSCWFLVGRVKSSHLNRSFNTDLSSSKKVRSLWFHIVRPTHGSCVNEKCGSRQSLSPLPPVVKLDVVRSPCLMV